jgi:hypothetical protein
MTDSGSSLAAGGGRQWHALLIGVDRYPAFPGKQLSGCVNDALAMLKFLVDKVQVPEANIRCLTSPREPAAGSSHPSANASNIRAAFDALAGRVKKDDSVVLYYAGHGLRLERLTGSGAKDRYYGFAPEDIADDKASRYANLILGSEIYALLRSIEEQGATATVIADTCHSGASTRAVDEDVRERSLQVEPLSEEQWQDFTARHPALQRAAPSGSRGVGDVVGPFGAYPGGDFVMLTGCLDSETSKEDAAILIGLDGQQTKATHGLLTLTLLKELEGVAPERVHALRWMDFFERLRSSVAQRAVELKRGSQVPALEGRREKTVFGGAWRPFAPGFTVRTVDDGTLTVDGGEMQGLETGAIIAIHPPDTSDFHNAATPGVEAVIQSATPMTSTACLREAGASVVDLSRARPVRPSPSTKPIVVRIAAGEAPMSEAMREAITRQPDAAQFFTLVSDTSEVLTPAHAELRRWKGDVPKGVWPEPQEAWDGARDGWVLVSTDRFGVPSADTKGLPTPDDVVAYLPDAGAPIDGIAAEKREATLGSAVGRGLSAYGRYLRARDRRAGDDTLSSMLEVKLRAGEGNYPTRHEDIEKVEPMTPVNGVYSATDSQWLWAEIRVMGTTRLGLQVGWVAFSDDGNFWPMWPIHGAKPSLSRGDIVHLGWDREQALTLNKRSDQSMSMFTLRVMACTASTGAPPLNVGSIEQKSVQQEFAAELEIARGLQSRAVAGPANARTEAPAWYAWDLRMAVSSAAS